MILSYQRYGKNGGGETLVFYLICSRGCTHRNLCYHVEIVNTPIKQNLARW